ncbi:MAG: hypothetical protein R3B81_14230 [bacterium]
MNKYGALSFAAKVLRDLVDLVAVIQAQSSDAALPEELQEELECLAREAHLFSASLPDAILRESVLVSTLRSVGDDAFRDDLPF